MVFHYIQTLQFNRIINPPPVKASTANPRRSEKKIDFLVLFILISHWHVFFVTLTFSKFSCIEIGSLRDRSRPISQAEKIVIGRELSLSVLCYRRDDIGSVPGRIPLFSANLVNFLFPVRTFPKYTASLVSITDNYNIPTINLQCIKKYF